MIDVLSPLSVPTPFQYKNASLAMTYRRHVLPVAEVMQSDFTDVTYFVADANPALTITREYGRSFLAQVYEMGANFQFIRDVCCSNASTLFSPFKEETNSTILLLTLLVKRFIPSPGQCRDRHSTVPPFLADLNCLRSGDWVATNMLGGLLYIPPSLCIVEVFTLILCVLVFSNSESSLL